MKNATQNTLPPEGMTSELQALRDTQEAEAFSKVAGRSRNISKLVRSMISLPTHPRVTRDYAQALATMLSKMGCHFVPALAFV